LRAALHAGDPRLIGAVLTALLEIHPPPDQEQKSILERLSLDTSLGPAGTTAVIAQIARGGGETALARLLKRIQSGEGISPWLRLDEAGVLIQITDERLTWQRLIRIILLGRGVPLPHRFREIRLSRQAFMDAARSFTDAGMPRARLLTMLAHRSLFEPSADGRHAGLQVASSLAQAAKKKVNAAAAVPKLGRIAILGSSVIRNDLLRFLVAARTTQTATGRPSQPWERLLACRTRILGAGLPALEQPRVGAIGDRSATYLRALCSAGAYLATASLDADPSKQNEFASMGLLLDRGALLQLSAVCRQTKPGWRRFVDLVLQPLERFGDDRDRDLARALRSGP